MKNGTAEIHVGAPDPELKTSPILEEYDEDAPGSGWTIPSRDYPADSSVKFHAGHLQAFHRQRDQFGRSIEPAIQVNLLEVGKVC